MPIDMLKHVSIFHKIFMVVSQKNNKIFKKGFIGTERGWGQNWF
jgi:hypothetical protein